jgi:hypothetical protein
VRARWLAQAPFFLEHAHTSEQARRPVSHAKPAVGVARAADDGSKCHGTWTRFASGVVPSKFHLRPASCLDKYSRWGDTAYTAAAAAVLFLRTDFHVARNAHL